MLNLRAFLTLSVALTLGGSAIAGSPGKNISAAAADRVATVLDHVPQLDGPLTMTTAPSGRALAAWAYHASGEFDIAVSSREKPWLAVEEQRPPVRKLFRQPRRCRIEYPRPTLPALLRSRKIDSDRYCKTEQA